MKLMPFCALPVCASPLYTFTVSAPSLKPFHISCLKSLDHRLNERLIELFIEYEFKLF